MTDAMLFLILFLFIHLCVHLCCLSSPPLAFSIGQQLEDGVSSHRHDDALWMRGRNTTQHQIGESIKYCEKVE